MGTLGHDLRFALRTLSRRPLFALLAIVPLVIGIGANATVFSLVNALLLRPLPAAEPDRLVRIGSLRDDGVRSGRLSYPDYLDVAASSDAFAGTVATGLATVAFDAAGTVEPLLGEVVSGNFFSVLGVGTVAGRAFDAEQAAPVAVISRRLYRQRFAGDPATLGRAVRLNGRSFTVVAVAAAPWRGTFAGAGVDVWVPLEHGGDWLGAGWREDRARPTVMVIARRAPGVSEAQAQVAMDTLSARLAADHASSHERQRLSVAPGTWSQGGLRRGATAFLSVVMAVVLLVLLLACANIASLLLARAAERRREIAVRLALGASRRQLVHQLLVESLVLAALGGAGGLAVAAGSGRALLAFNPLPSLPIHLDLAPDGRVLAFTLAVTVLSGILLGLAPITQAFRRRARLAPGGGDRVRRRGMVLVGAQVALSLVLLTSAGLFLRSLAAAQGLDPGFVTARALATDLDLATSGHDEAAGRRFYRQLLPALEAVPGVRSATLANLAPLDTATPWRDVTVPGRTAPGGDGERVSWNRVGDGYFATLGIPILRGRALGAGDRRQTPAVTVVNQALADRFWPGEDPLGRGLRLDDGRQVTVVGVARDVKLRTLGEAPTPHLYLPFAQHYSASMTVLVATGGDPGAMIQPVQRAIQALDARVVGHFSRTLEAHAALALVPARLAGTLFTLFGAVALILTVVGVYGAAALAVARRTRELGIRQAVGATRGDVLRLVLGDSARVAVLGAGAGLLLALALGRLLAGQLLAVRAGDPLILAAAAAAVIVSVLAAGWLPALRATRVDPLTALRHE